MAFATSTTFHRFCQNSQTRIASSSPITAAALDTLITWGQVPIVGIAGTFSTYSVLNNGVLVASNLTASTYTITGLGNNVQIGPVTLVPYDANGTAGRAFTVTGGSGAGKIYTWAQANTPTFSTTTSGGTTLACTGAFSKVYVTFSGGSGTPASGTLIITSNNSISQNYTGMVSNTSYSFNVYPVNGDGIPVSATGTNVVTGSVTTLPPPPIWVSGGNGTLLFSLAYSTNGFSWTGIVGSRTLFTTIGRSVAYSADQNLWVAAGQGTGNTLAYSTNAITWTGLGTEVFSTLGLGVIYHTTQKLWVAGGQGAVNTLAYSTNGTTWTGLGKTIFSSFGHCFAYNNNLWLAGGGVPTLSTTGNTLAYSTDGITWTGRGLAPFSTSGRCFAYRAAAQQLWVAMGQGGNTLAYSTDGFNWTGRGASIFSTFGHGVAYNNNLWAAAGDGINSLAYSTNGFNWTGRGYSIFEAYGFAVVYSAAQNVWVSGGAVNTNGNTLAYSTDGFSWTGRGVTPYDSRVNGLTCSS